MGLKLIAPPIVEPMGKEELKKHLRLDGSDEDDWIVAIIQATREHAEVFTGRQFMTATYDFTLEEFPSERRWGTIHWQSEIPIPRPPLQSVTSITYVDLNGTTQTLATTVYEVDTSIEPGVVRLKFDQSWPVARNQANAITIRFVAGYTLTSLVPASIKHAMKVHAGHLYENREASIVGSMISEVPLGYEALLWPNRILEAV